jgi:hypothetical protein
VVLVNVAQNQTVDAGRINAEYIHVTEKDVAVGAGIEERPACVTVNDGGKAPRFVGKALVRRNVIIDVGYYDSSRHDHTSRQASPIPLILV